MAKSRVAIAVQAVELLDLEIRLRAGELAVLERGREVLLRSLAKHPDRCPGFTRASPCSGPLAARWCLRCGAAFLACAAHGSTRAVSRSHRTHVLEAHP